MGVRVNAARHDNHAAGIDGKIVPDIQLFGDFRDNAILDGKVEMHGITRQTDEPAFDDCPHLEAPLSFAMSA